MPPVVQHVSGPGAGSDDGGKGPQIMEPLKAIALNPVQQDCRGNLQGGKPQSSYLVLLPTQGQPYSSDTHERTLVTVAQEPQVSPHAVVCVHDDHTPFKGQQDMDVVVVKELNDVVELIGFEVVEVSVVVLVENAVVDLQKYFQKNHKIVNSTFLVTLM